MKTQFLKKSILLGALCALLIGCASALERPTPQYTQNNPLVNENSVVDTVYLNSEPGGAKVYLNEALVGTTPCTVRLNYTITNIFYNYVVYHDPRLLGQTVWQSRNETNINPPGYNIKVFKEGYKVSTINLSYGGGNTGTNFNKVVFLEKDEKPFRIPVEVYPPSGRP